MSLYDFSIKYWPRLKNADADGLSRRPQETISEDNVRSICNGILSQEPGQIGVFWVHQVQAVDWWKRQAADDAICYTASFVESGKRPSYKNKCFLPDEAKALLYEFDMLVLTDGVLYWKQQKDDQEVYQIVLPQEYHKTALQGLHDNARHLGIEKTLNFVWEWFLWPKMAKDVEDYVKSCERCI